MCDHRLMHGQKDRTVLTTNHDVLYSQHQLSDTTHCPPKPRWSNFPIITPLFPLLCLCACCRRRYHVLVHQMNSFHSSSYILFPSYPTISFSASLSVLPVVSSCIAASHPPSLSPFFHCPYPSPPINPSLLYSSYMGYDHGDETPRRILLSACLRYGKKPIRY